MISHFHSDKRVVPIATFYSFKKYIASTCTIRMSRLIVVCLMLSFGIIAQKNDENCETLMSEIHVTKDEYDETGQLIRTCTGDVSVKKCEGFCNSQVQPSVITTTGFFKECYCCRESYLKERMIKLNYCYDADGMKVRTTDLSTMEIKLREPAECKCYKCGDFSR